MVIYLKIVPGPMLGSVKHLYLCLIRSFAVKYMLDISEKLFMNVFIIFYQLFFFHGITFLFFNPKLGEGGLCGFPEREKNNISPESTKNNQKACE